MKKWTDIIEKLTMLTQLSLSRDTSFTLSGAVLVEQ